MKTLVIIPTYNEKDNLPRAAAGVLARGDEYDVLIVDDLSPDGTGAVADSLAAAHPGRVFVRHRPAKSGLGSAYLEGFRFGRERGYEALCEMDADGSHDPADLPRLLAAVRGGAGLAIGSRRVRGGKITGWGLKRHLLSWGAGTLTRLMLGVKARDATAGYRCYSAAAADAVLAAPVMSRGYSFQEETLFYVERAGFRVVEVPVVFRDRERGGSKLDWREITASLGHLWRLRRSRRRPGTSRKT